MDYSTLSETLTVRKDVHTSSSVTDIIKDNKDLEKAYDELWKQIQEIRSKLQPGEELWIGKTKIDSTTQKEDIIKYFTKAISPENMSKDELIKALQEQERIAKSSTYVANKGSDYEETKKNYYSGEKTDEFKHFIGKDMRLEQVSLRKTDLVKELLEFYMGKNTMERQNFIIDNLVIEEDIA